MDETIANAHETIALWLETMMDDGGTIPAPSSVAELQALTLPLETGFLAECLNTGKENGGK